MIIYIFDKVNLPKEVSKKYRKTYPADTIASFNSIEDLFVFSNISTPNLIIIKEDDIKKREIIHQKIKDIFFDVPIISDT